MTPRRYASLVVGSGLFALVGLAGCSHSSDSSSHPATSPKAALVASVEPLASTSYAVTLTSSDISAIGAVDPVDSAFGKLRGGDAA